MIGSVPSMKDAVCGASPAHSPSALPGDFSLTFASFVPLLATWGLHSLLAPCLQGEKINEPRIKPSMPTLIITGDCGSCLGAHDFSVDAENYQLLLYINQFFLFQG